MESYACFLERIDSFEKRELSFGGCFRGNASIAQKVDQDNRFRSFYGDTVVFDLEYGVKEYLTEIADTLYGEAPECFCERLASDTFHMTLHDLSSSPVLEEIAAEVFGNEIKVIRKAKQIRIRNIKMRSKYIFNMVNTSLVLGLYPVNEEEYHKLMELYGLFEEIKPLDYPLTPHITLAYYHINGFDPESAGKLESIVRKLNANEIEVELDVGKLYYQKFLSMNEYINVVNLGAI